MNGNFLKIDRQDNETVKHTDGIDGERDAVFGDLSCKRCREKKPSGRAGYIIIAVFIIIVALSVAVVVSGVGTGEKSQAAENYYVPGIISQNKSF